MKYCFSFIFLFLSGFVGYSQNPDTVTSIEAEKNIKVQPLWPSTHTNIESNSALLTYIYTQLQYPNEAWDNMIEGDVIIRFIIDSTGKVIDPGIVKDIGGGCGEAALEVVQRMQREITWTPGYDNTNSVNTPIDLVITFNLENHPLFNFVFIRYAIIVVDKSGQRYMNEADFPFNLSNAYNAEIVDSFKTLKGIERHQLHTEEVFYRDVKQFYVNDYLFSDEAQNLEEYLISCEVVHSLVDRRPLFMISQDEVLISQNPSDLYELSRLRLKDYIQKHLKYPRRLRKAGIMGLSVVNFIIDRDGYVSEIQLSRSSHPELDKIALQFVQDMNPNYWSPGLKNGKPVRTRFKLPIKFEE